MTNSSALSVLSLSKVYENSSDGPAGGIRDASFELPEGAFFTLLGPSGCGKTTTLRCIAGLEFPDSGSIHVGGLPFYDSASGTWVPMNERGIGMVFQSYAIWPHMTVFENVAFPLRVSRGRRFSRNEIETMVGEALRSVSLDGFGSRQATRLSGGQQQRVALARAIVRRPRLLLLDEPLSNLDATLREDMRNELKRLQQQLGVTTVYVTHDQTEALEMSDVVAIINQGKIVQMGPPREIYFSPENAFVASFVGATNLVAGTRMPAADDRYLPVKIINGQVINCARRSSCASSDTSVSISVRPETIMLRQIGAPYSEATNRIEGEVVLSGFLGNMNRYSIRAGDTVFQASTDAETHFAVGAKVAMDFPAESTLAFSS